jgi:hypothetical protein
MSNSTKENILAVYQVYLGHIDKHIGNILQALYPELDDAINQLNLLNKELQTTAMEHNQITGNSVMTLGLPKTTQQILKLSEKITKVIELPLNEIYENNKKNSLKDTLTQLKTIAVQTRENIEKEISQTKLKR